MFDEGVLVDEGSEFVGGDEVVLNSVLFAFPW